MKDTLRAARSLVARTLGAVPGSSRTFGPIRGYAANSFSYLAANLTEGKVTELSPRRARTRKKVAYADPHIAPSINNTHESVTKQRFVAELPDGRYWGYYPGCVVTRSDVLLGDLSPSLKDSGESESAPEHHLASDVPFLPKIQRFPGKVAICTTLFSNNFHHWLLDTLPRIQMLEEAGYPIASLDHIIVPRSLRAWHKETFERLNFPSERLIHSTPTLHLEASLLIAPSYSEPGMHPGKYEYTMSGLQFLRKLFLDNNPHLDREWPARIAVSREKATTRRITPHAPFYEGLTAIGFKTIYLEDYSLAEQAAMFAQAEAVMMPTGGGLANVAYCSPGTKFYELFNPCYLPTFCYGLTDQLGIEYYALCGETEPGFEKHIHQGNQRDIPVDASRLLEIIRSSLA